MNIRDFKSSEKNVKDVLKKIFARQFQLMVKYKEIEGLPQWPLDIDTKDNQIILKDFLWRSVEELSEAFEAFEKDEEEHFFEELIDYLHFATELAILCGYTHKDFTNIDDLNVDPIYIKEDIAMGTFLVVYRAGLVGNCLKNKKWKQTQIFTDKEKFKKIFIDFYNSGLDFLLSSGLSSDDIYNYYYKKSEVNKFRQRSMY